MKFLFITLFSVLMFGCANLTEPEPELEIQGDWMVLPMPEGVFAELESFHMETYEVVIPANDWIETKVEMNAGDSIIYRWELVEDETTTEQTTENIYTEFHGHKPRIEGQLGELMYFRKATGGFGQGSFKSPFTGVHGWFIDNTNDQDITVRVHIAGEFARYD